MLLKISRFKMYATVVLLLALYECESFSHTLRRRHRLEVPEDGTLSRTFVSKKDEITGECRESHNERLHNFASSNQEDREARHVARKGYLEKCRNLKRGGHLKPRCR
jgi:hypothetical protein